MTTNTEMYLFAATNAVGSECSTPLGITKNEWEVMTEEEQQQLIGESLSDVADIWVTGCEYIHINNLVFQAASDYKTSVVNRSEWENSR